METQLRSRVRTQPITEESSTDAFIVWTRQRFAHQHAVMTTAFGMEGCALIDMYAASGQPFTVVYLDTMFFFEETYRLRDRLIERYPHVDFVNRGTNLTPDQQAKRYGEELWKTDPDLCCKLRKVDPMHDVLLDVDVWITAVRRSQSPARAHLRRINWDYKYQLLKVCPLIDWERAKIWEYIKERDVPYNELHEKGYPTVGCTHCTACVAGLKIDEYSRAGRWNGRNKTECGLHGEGS